MAQFIGDGGFGDERGSYLVTSQTTGRGFADLPTVENAISMASRRIKPKEARALRDAGKGNMVSVDQEHIIAFENLDIIVNPENGINSISIPDLQRVYSGEINNWQKLGGDDRPIVIVHRPEGSGTKSTFLKLVFDKDVPPTPKTALIAQDNNDVAALVNENPGAIGYAGHAFQRGAKPLSLINECGIASTPDAFSAKTEEYTLGRRLYLYNVKDANQDARNFISFATSSDADLLIQKSGFIDLGIEKREQTMEGYRAKALMNADVDAYEGKFIKEMLNEMKHTERLSTTFRFRTGSLRLDELGMFTMARLVEYLKDLPEGTKVTMVGFTDNVGTYDANLKISRDRAEQVIKILNETAGDQVSHIKFSASGYGQIAPSGCNSSEAGRGINRRVEVWVSN